jgi:hypothetical protein
MIFQYNQFREFLRRIKGTGQTSLFREWTGEKVFLIRHDVDFDINLAHELAKVERDEQVSSTFFILTTCENYNVLSPRNQNLLREMDGMGHEIGLHFDPTLYSSEMEEALEKELDILSFAVGREIKSISLHNPSLHGQYPIFEKYINAYDARMFSDENYISDSRFLFRGKDPFEFIGRIDKGMVQILLHPLHFSEEGYGYDEIFAKAFISHMKRIHDDFLVNSTYRDHVGEDIIAVLKRSLS